MPFRCRQQFYLKAAIKWRLLVEQDMERQQLNVFRMRLLGAEVWLLC